MSAHNMTHISTRWTTTLSSKANLPRAFSSKPYVAQIWSSYVQPLEPKRPSYSIMWIVPRGRRWGSGTTCGPGETDGAAPPGTCNGKNACIVQPTPLHNMRRFARIGGRGWGLRPGFYPLGEVRGFHPPPMPRDSLDVISPHKCLKSIAGGKFDVG